MVEMSRPFPEVVFEDLGTHDHIVAPLQVLLPFPFLDEIAEHHPLGMKDDQPRPRFVVHLEEIQLPAQTAVIPLFGFPHHPQVFVQRLLGGKAGPVNPLEHPVALVAPPIGAGHIKETEGLDHDRRGQMRTPAEVFISRLRVNTHGPDIGWEIVDQFDLVGLSLVLEQGHSLLPGKLPAGEGGIGGGDLLHPLFDFL